MPQTSEFVEDNARTALLNGGYTSEHINEDMDICSEGYLKSKGWKIRRGTMKEPGTWGDLSSDEKFVARYLIEEWDYAMWEGIADGQESA